MSDSGPKMEMPKYRCHKEVWALKIAIVSLPTPTGGVRLTFDDARYAPMEKDRQWDERHRPQPGGYYVVYDDGYASYSPAAAFESGYTRL